MIWIVYECQECGNIGRKRIEGKHESLKCSLCQANLVNNEGIAHKNTEDEARDHLRVLANRKRMRRKSSVSRTGLGVRKRLINIIDSLVQLNKGRGVTEDEIMRECMDAGIDQERATEFLNSLLNDRVAINHDGIIELDGNVVL